MKNIMNNIIKKCLKNISTINIMKNIKFFVWYCIHKMKNKQIYLHNDIHYTKYISYDSALGVFSYTHIKMVCIAHIFFSTLYST